MCANPRRDEDHGPDGRERDARDEERWGDESGAQDAAVVGAGEVRRPADMDHGRRCDDADRRATDAAYAEHKRKFVAAGGVGARFDGLKILEAARLQANRIWGVMARVRGEAATPAPEREVRSSLDGLAIEAQAARSKGRLRAFARRLWPFGLPYG